MHQLAQKLKSGEMAGHELPCPQAGPRLAPGMVLVRNHYSLVSAGTEGSTVKTARASLIAKAKERPQQMKQVLEVLMQQGPVQTYRAVMKKLEAWSPLGYSCVGEVIGVAPDVSEFSIGVCVACGGLTASHAEVVAVPVNLCVKIQSRAHSAWRRALKDSRLRRWCKNTASYRFQPMAIFGNYIFPLPAFSQDRQHKMIRLCAQNILPNSALSHNRHHVPRKRSGQ